VLEISSYQVGCPGGLRTLKENIVVRFGTRPDGFRGPDPKALLANGVKRGGDYVFVAADDFLVLGVYIPTNAELN
jgi:hypothetical protein